VHRQVFIALDPPIYF